MNPSSHRTESICFNRSLVVERVITAVGKGTPFNHFNFSIRLNTSVDSSSMAFVVTPVKFAVLIFLISQCVLNHQSRLAVVDASLAESKEYMRGKVVRVAVFHVIILFFDQFINSNYKLMCISHFYMNTWHVKYPPLMTIKNGQDGTLRFRGLAFDILNYFAQALGIRYS